MTQKNDARSFEYAIRPDGTLLAEVLWKKRKREGQSYVFTDETSLRKLSSSLPPNQQRQLYMKSSEISLAKIEGLVKKSMLEHKRLTFLPAEPKTTIKPPVAASLSSNIPAPVPSSSTTTSFPPARLLENQQKDDKFQRNSDEKDIVRENDPIRSNQQPQTNRTNSAPSSFYSKSNHETAGPSNSSQKAAATTRQKSNAKEDDEFDDDDVFNDFDVDQVISEHKNHAVTDHRPIATSNNARFDSTNRDSFNYQPAEPRRSSNYGECSKSGGENSFRNNHNPQHQDDPIDFYGDSSFDNNNNSNFGGNNDYGSSNNTSFGGNGNQFESQKNNSYGEANDGGDHPLCPGHGLPCRLLTANTSINMGREFYKCSLPEGQSCDFFQWKDGMEGNWNDNHHDSMGGANSNISGQILEMNQENRRVFGHRSFRKGQKDVIEAAIQGRDVFVLMPTGCVTCISSLFHSCIFVFRRAFFCRMALRSKP